MEKRMDSYPILKGTLSSPVVRGYSAYELAVKNGFIGTEQDWLDSIEGNSKKISSLLERIDKLESKLKGVTDTLENNVCLVEQEGGIIDGK